MGITGIPWHFSFGAWIAQTGRDASRVDSIAGAFARLRSLRAVCAADASVIAPLEQKATSTIPDAPLPQVTAGITPASPAKGTPLTLADAIAMAMRNNPRLEEASAITRRAEGAARAARAYSNPSLEVFEGQQYAKPVAIPGLPGLLQHYAAYQTIEIPV